MTLGLFAVFTYATAALLATSVKDDGPIAKVTHMLEDMQIELANEKSTDEELYHKLACWCQSTRGTKEASIAAATTLIDRLRASVMSLTSKTHQLVPEIATIKEDMAENEKALSESEEMRKKEKEEFILDEKELIASIAALKGAVAAMAKHHTAFLQGARWRKRHAHSFLQTDASEAEGLLRELQPALIPRMLARAHLSTEQRAALAAFMQHRSPGTDVVFGILAQMEETFEKNLEQTRATEKDTVAEFAKLKGAKTRELTAIRANLDASTQELATTEESLAADKQNLADTEAGLKADTKSLLGVKEQCAEGDKEFEERRKARSVEEKAVAECISLMRSDAVTTAFNTTNGTVSFLQVSALTRTTAAAARSGSRARLAAKLDSFDNVKKAVDTMIAELQKAQQDDEEHKSLCEADTKENDEQTESTEAAIKQQTTEEAEAVATLEELEADIGDLQAELNETKAQMAAAGKDREAANGEYQMTIANQHAAQNVLQLALHKMQLVYLQQTPPDMGEYSPNEKGGGVIGLLESIVEDSKALEAEATKAEKASQESYSEFIKNSNDAIKVVLESMAEKKLKRGKGHASLTYLRKDIASSTQTLDDLQARNATLHDSCSFILKHWDVISQKRGDEIEALHQAMDILSGAA